MTWEPKNKTDDDDDALISDSDEKEKEDDEKRDEAGERSGTAGGRLNRTRRAKTETNVTTYSCLLCRLLNGTRSVAHIKIPISVNRINS